METVQVHSKAFVIRWVNCIPGNVVSWKIRPEKKSIKFGVYQFDQSQIKTVESQGIDNEEQLGERLVAAGGKVLEKIQRVPGGELHNGDFHAELSVVAFVFDNTFSKNTAKNVNFSCDVVEPEAGSLPKSQPLTAQSDEKLSDGPVVSSDHRYLSGTLQKRRRKKLQGYAPRYFSLDTTRGLLNYYLDNRSGSLRGVMPVKICEIDVSTSPLIVIDSGVEKWFLKAHSDKSWKAWVNALQATRNQQYGRMLSREPSLNAQDIDDTAASADWKEVAQALDQAKSATRDHINGGSAVDHAFIDKLMSCYQIIEQVILRHVGEEEDQYHDASFAHIHKEPTIAEAPVEDEREAAPTGQKNAKASSAGPAVAGAVGGAALGGFAGHSADSGAATSAPVSGSPPTPADTLSPSKPDVLTPARSPAPEEDDDIFYDAEDDGESDLSSVDSEDEESVPAADEHEETLDPGFYPLPHDHVDRRKTVPRCEHQPPSLLSLLRKSKDIGSMSVPVTSNEPISVLQKLAETYEYTELLDEAAKATSEDERLLYSAAFVVSALACLRIKDRAMRKPFNPMLGEVYELVREDKDFRFLAEKVSHRPPIFATHAESELWTTQFTSRPYQKIWGKSAEITDTGVFKITFPQHEDTIECSMPDCFLRNLIAGEKYLEPVGTVTLDSSKGASATIEFKAGGMFSGRSEELKITSGKLHAEGKWTEHLSLGKKTIWKVGELVSQPKEHYGWPVFTATLNEITAIERGHISPVDSRLRPDQIAYEKQDIDKAEHFKQELEQRQRERRKVAEEQGRSWEPIFFTRGHSETGNFIPKTGKQNYWARRKAHDWEGIIPVLDPEFKA